MADLLVDTDIFIDHLRGARRLDPLNHRLHYSVITRAELFVGAGRNESQVRLLLEAFRELGVDRSVAERAGRIRRESSIRMPDALIAATAIEQDLELVSRNTRDFSRVKNLVTHPAVPGGDQPETSIRSDG